MKERSERIQIVPSKLLAAGFPVFIALLPQNQLMRLFSVTNKILGNNVSISSPIKVMSVTC